MTCCPKMEQLENDLLTHLDEYRFCPFCGRDLQHQLKTITIRRIILPRRQASNVDEIKASIKDIGLMEPITVERLKRQRYRLWDGLTRLIAYRDLGYLQIPALVKPRLTPEQVRVLLDTGCKCPD